jgi:predicted ATPase
MWFVARPSTALYLFNEHTTNTTITIAPSSCYSLPLPPPSTTKYRATVSRPLVSIDVLVCLVIARSHFITTNPPPPIMMLQQSCVLLSRPSGVLCRLVLPYHRSLGATAVVASRLFATTKKRVLEDQPFQTSWFHNNRALTTLHHQCLADRKLLLVFLEGIAGAGKQALLHRLAKLNYQTVSVPFVSILQQQAALDQHAIRNTRSLWQDLLDQSVAKACGSDAATTHGLVFVNRSPLSSDVLEAAATLTSNDTADNDKHKQYLQHLASTRQHYQVRSTHSLTHSLTHSRTHARTHRPLSS